MRQRAVMFGMKKAADEAMRLSARRFRRNFKLSHPGFRRPKSVLDKPGRALVKAGVYHFVKPATMLVRENAYNYFRRMLLGGVETARTSKGMLVPAPDVKIVGAKRRRLRGGKTAIFYDVYEGGKHTYWRHYKSGEQVYQGVFKQTVVNPRNLWPANRTLTFVARYARRRVRFHLEREMQTAIVRGLGFRTAR